MKKLLSLILTAILVIAAVMAVPASAASGFVIEDGVLLRYTGSDADVTVPDGVYAVGASAFEGNTSVATVTLPATVYSIGDAAFRGCGSLTDVTGSGVTTVGAYAFDGTPYLEQSTAEFFTLGSCLLWYNGSAAKVRLPEGIVGIAPLAFAGCEEMTSFTARQGLTVVGDGAFYACSSLENVSLPATVTYIGAYAFDGTAFLNGAVGFVILGDGILVRYEGSDAKVTVPDTVRRIAAGAFAGNLSLEQLIVPASVYSIDKGACKGCTGLRALSLHSGLVYIGNGAFRSCTALTRLVTPATLAYIGDGAFEGCTSLVSVNIKGTDLTLAAQAFAGCTGLRYAMLSDGAAEIGSRAFAGCAALEGISIPAQARAVSADALDRCPNVTVCCETDSAAAAALSECRMNCVIGNNDEDGILSIFDATRIQRYLVGIHRFSGDQICISDMDHDGDLTVFDVTCIQRRLVGLS